MWFWNLAAVNVVDRIAKLLLQRLLRIFLAKLPIFIDGARDDSDVQALGTLGFAVDVEAQARLAAVAQPLLEAEAVALRLRDFLALLVEEHLVVEALGRAAAEDSGDLRR